MRGLLLFAAALVFTGCHRHYLDCRSEYLHPSYLASQAIDTPDPLRDCFYGQQIIVRWILPRLTKPAALLLKVRYGNREIATLTAPVETPFGGKIYRLVNRDYWCKNGILSFQAQLIQEGEILDTWTHSLWAEIIEIPCL